MATEQRKFKREPARQRRGALIAAALSLIAEKGVRGATVREIASRADVTQGLIRHYFSSKDDLIQAAYSSHMGSLTELTFAAPEGAAMTARARLAALVDASLRPPVIDARSVALWAGFLNVVQQDAEMRAIHRRTYEEFRDRLQALIAAALAEAGTPIDPPRARQLAIACNALIDGLWLEGGALPEAFAPDELCTIGRRSVSALIGLDLEQTGDKQ